MSTDSCRTLWIGDIQTHWDELFIAGLFPDAGGEIEVKLIRDKVTGYPSGYGFVEFLTHEAAAEALERYNGQLVEGTAVRYRLNWGAGGARIESAPEYSIFVGDLTPEVTDVMLRQTFADQYQSVLGAKIVTDLATGASKGFGFVRFSNEEERDMSFAMQGSLCAGRPMRVAPATKRATPPSTYAAQHYGQDDTRVLPDDSGTIPGGDITNTTIFVGGLSDSVTEDALHSIFECQGPILYVKIPPGRGCGFISFAERSSAEGALTELQGVEVGGCKVRLSWGKSQRERASAALGLSSMTDLSMSLAMVDLNGGMGGRGRAGPQWAAKHDGGLVPGIGDMYGAGVGGGVVGGGYMTQSLQQQQQAAYYAAYAQYLGYDIAQQQAIAAQQAAYMAAGARIASPPGSDLYGGTSPYPYGMAPSPLTGMGLPPHQQPQHSFPYAAPGSLDNGHHRGIYGMGNGGGNMSNGMRNGGGGGRGAGISINVNADPYQQQQQPQSFPYTRSPVGTIGRTAPLQVPGMNGGGMPRSNGNGRPQQQHPQQGGPPQPQQQQQQQQQQPGDGSPLRGGRGYPNGPPHQ